jgi:probable F420-dependent oxidoreductase
MGYDSLWTGDRVLAPYVPGAPCPSGDGEMPRAYENRMDPLVALTFAASHTTRVHLGTSTLNGSWLPPIMLARALTTLDVLSQGLLIVGLGLGWMPDEYTAVSMPWKGRGARLDETLDVLEEYWAGDVFSHRGPLFTIPETMVGLKPRQRPGPPVLLAAFTPGGLRRIGRRLDGWLPVAIPIAHLMDMWDVIQKEAVQADGDPSALRMALRLNPRLTDTTTAPADAPGGHPRPVRRLRAGRRRGRRARAARGLRADPCLSHRTRRPRRPLHRGRPPRLNRCATDGAGTAVGCPGTPEHRCSRGTSVCQDVPMPLRRVSTTTSAA